MSLSPQTSVSIYSLKSCDIQYNNVMYIPQASRLSVLSSLSQKTVLYYTSIQYIRENTYVDLPVLYDTAHDYNYLTYDNDEGEGTIFNFITDVEFINFECTRFYIKKDVWMQYSNSVNKTALIDRIHSKTRSSIADIVIDPQKSNGIVRCDNIGNYYFAIEISFKLSVFGTAINKKSFFTTLPAMHFIYKYSISDNSITPYGKTSEFEFLIQYVSKLDNSVSMSIYYVHPEMLNLYTYVEASNVLSGVSFTGYYLNQTSPLDKYLSYTRTITLGNPYITKYNLLNRYPYARRYLYTSSSQIPVNPLTINGTISVTTTLCDDADGIQFRHEISKQGESEKYVIYEKSASMTMFKDSIAEFISRNSVKMLSQIAMSLTTAVTGGATAGLSINSAQELYTRPGSSMSIEQYENMAGSAELMNRQRNINNAINIGSSLLESAFKPAQINNQDSAQSAMCFMLPNMIGYYDVTLYDDQIKYCIDTWNTTGQKFNKVMDMNYTVGKYYTYIKAIAYSSQIKNQKDAKEFENILLNGVTIWNMSNLTDYKNYGEYVDNEVNLA